MSSFLKGLHHSACKVDFDKHSLTCARLHYQSEVQGKCQPCVVGVDAKVSSTEAIWVHVTPVHLGLQWQIIHFVVMAILSGFYVFHSSAQGNMCVTLKLVWPDACIAMSNAT